MADMRARVAAEIPHLRRFAYVLVGTGARADDLVQDALEQAWRKRHSWRQTGTLRSWMLRILYRTHANALRARKGDAVEFDERWHTEISGDASEAQDVKLELDDFSRALAVLPPEQRSAVMLIGVEGMSYEAAADRQRVPVGTLRSRLFRGRNTLTRIMETGDARLRPRLKRGD